MKTRAERLLASRRPMAVIVTSKIQKRSTRLQTISVASKAEEVQAGDIVCAVVGTRRRGNRRYHLPIAANTCGAMPRHHRSMNRRCRNGLHDQFSQSVWPAAKANTSPTVSCVSGCTKSSESERRAARAKKQIRRDRCLQAVSGRGVLHLSVLIEQHAPRRVRTFRRQAAGHHASEVDTA